MSPRRREQVLTSAVSHVSQNHPLGVLQKALHRAVGHKSAPIQRISQRLPRWASSSIKRWYAAKNEPSLSAFVDLATEYDEVFEAFLEMTGRDIQTEAQKEHLRKALEALEGAND